MREIKTLRRRRGLSQRGLAARAGVAFRTVQLLESGRHDARLSTLAKVGRALGRPEAALSRALARSLQADDSIETVSTMIGEEGEDSWKAWLFEFVDAFRAEPRPELVAAPPDPRLSHRLQALLASTVEHLCAQHGIPAPLWCAGVPPLPVPWFVAGMESLKASALVESPAHFRRRGIFVLGNFLSRA